MVGGGGPQRNGGRRGHCPEPRRNSAASCPFTTMVGIPVTAAAYDAIKRSVPGQRGSPPLPSEDGLIRIWLDCKFVDLLGQ